MTNPHWRILAGAAVGLTFVLRVLAVDPPAGVPPDRAQFESGLQGIESAYTNEVRELANSYGRALAQLKQKVQAAGDLDRVLAVGGEITRFSTTGSIVADDVVNAPPELADLQRQFIKQNGTRLRQRYEDAIQLAQQYDARLATQQSKMTVAGDIAAAMAVKAERERARLDSTVTAAEFELAILNEEAPPTTVAAPETEEPAPATEGAGPAAVTAPPVSTSPPAMPDASGVIVFGAGQKPPEFDAATVKRLLLIRTENARTSTSLAVTATYSIRASSDRSRGFVDGRSESSVDRRSLRLQLRSSPATGVINEPIVVVQAFIKNAASQGRIDPIQGAVHIVPLSQASPNTTTIDFPPVETHMQRTRYGVGASKSSSGQEFYGFIVSIFSHDQKLLYQGVSTRGLLDLATDTIPKAHGTGRF